MRVRHWLTGVAIATAAGHGAIAAQAPAPPAPGEQPPAARPGEVAKADAETFIAQCGPRKFETETISDNNGKVRKAKILLCAKPTDSDDQWITTLEKAARQIEASPELSAQAKTKVIGDIQAAIGRMRGAAGGSPQAGPAQAGQVATLPTTPIIEPRLVRPLEPLASNVRPLPPRPAPGQVARALPPIAKPKLSVSCALAGDPGAAMACIDLEATTLLVIRAGENLSAKTSLRFVRDGEQRGGLALGMMRRGQVIRARLPSRLCSGVVRGRVVIQTIVNDPQSGAERVADSHPPLNLRC